MLQRLFLLSHITSPRFSLVSFLLCDFTLARCVSEAHACNPSTQPGKLGKLTVQADTCRYTQIDTHTHTHTHEKVQPFTIILYCLHSMCVHMCICMYVCACMHVCMYVCVHTCIAPVQQAAQALPEPIAKHDIPKNSYPTAFPSSQSLPVSLDSFQD